MLTLNCLNCSLVKVQPTRIKGPHQYSLSAIAMTKKCNRVKQPWNMKILWTQLIFQLFDSAELCHCHVVRWKMVRNQLSILITMNRFVVCCFTPKEDRWIERTDDSLKTMWARQNSTWSNMPGTLVADY